MFVITIITIIGNAAVISAIRRTRTFPAVYPLASLAAADLMLGLFVLPIAAARELFVFQPNTEICAFWSTMDVFCCTASILSLCSVGWERWSAITSPLDRARRTKWAKWFAVLIWPIAAAVAIPTAMIPSPVHYHPDKLVKACTVNTNVSYVFFSVTFSFYLPASCMTVMYFRILTALASTPAIRKHVGRAKRENNEDQIERKCEASCVTPVQSAGSQLVNRTPKLNNNDVMSPNLAVDTTNHNHNANLCLSPKGRHLNPPATVEPIPSPLKSCRSPRGLFPRQRQATQTIITLMSVFLICWCPFFIMLPIDSLCDCASDSTMLICTWLGYANSAFDPLVYAAASPTVRRALHASFTLSSSTRSNELPLTPGRRRLNV